MPSEIYLVKAGMTMEEGTVEEWYVADGERVEPGEMLYRLETEKVNLDVDAETAGTVKHLANAGTTCKAGEVVGFIYADDETIRPSQDRISPAQAKQARKTNRTNPLRQNPGGPGDASPRHRLRGNSPPNSASTLPMSTGRAQGAASPRRMFRRRRTRRPMRLPHPKRDRRRR